MGIYLDWAATSLPDPLIISAVSEKSLAAYGNPSSRHNPGIEARMVIEESRERCAAALSSEGGRLFFTSGGTESNNLALLSLLRKKKKGEVICSAIEHPSVSEPVKILSEAGFRIRKINPGKSGIIDPDKIEAALSSETVLVSVMQVNNETGALQPVREIGKLVKKHSASTGQKILFHCDGVQGAGKFPVFLSKSDIDLYTASSHKISGPKGIGLLYCRESILPLITGGGQEKGIRPGTENTGAIYGFSLALEKWTKNCEQYLEHAGSINSRLVSGLAGIKNCYLIPSDRRNLITHGQTANNEQQVLSPLYSPYILNFRIGRIPGEVLARVMSDRGFYISSGSACSSNNKKHSDVLRAMKISPDEALASVRVSTGTETKADDIDAFCLALAEESEKLLKVYPGT